MDIEMFEKSFVILHHNPNAKFRRGLPDEQKKFPHSQPSVCRSQEFYGRLTGCAHLKLYQLSISHSWQTLSAVLFYGTNFFTKHPETYFVIRLHGQDFCSIVSYFVSRRYAISLCNFAIVSIGNSTSYYKSLTYCNDLLKLYLTLCCIRISKYDKELTSKLSFL